jgi:hypothetical protein
MNIPELAAVELLQEFRDIEIGNQQVGDPKQGSDNNDHDQGGNNFLVHFNFPF